LKPSLTPRGKLHAPVLGAPAPDEAEAVKGAELGAAE